MKVATLKFAWNPILKSDKTDSAVKQQSEQLGIAHNFDDINNLQNILHIFIDWVNILKSNPF